MSFARAPPYPAPDVVPAAVDSSASVTVRNILINQATCYGCNTILTNRGICTCGNVEIYGDNVELGRTVKNQALYSDCSLLEYVPRVVKV